MPHRSDDRPVRPARGRPRRFISQFAELELRREQPRRTLWLLAAVVIAVSLALLLYDMLGH